MNNSTYLTRDQRRLLEALADGCILVGPQVQRKETCGPRTTWVCVLRPHLDTIGSLTRRGLIRHVPLDDRTMEGGFGTISEQGKRLLRGLRP